MVFITTAYWLVFLTSLMQVLTLSFVLPSMFIFWVKFQSIFVAVAWLTSLLEVL